MPPQDKMLNLLQLVTSCLYFICVLTQFPCPRQLIIIFYSQDDIIALPPYNKRNLWYLRKNEWNVGQLPKTTFCGVHSSLYFLYYSTSPCNLSTLPCLLYNVATTGHLAFFWPAYITDHPGWLIPGSCQSNSLLILEGTVGTGQIFMSIKRQWPIINYNCPSPKKDVKCCMSAFKIYSNIPFNPLTNG